MLTEETFLTHSRACARVRACVVEWSGADYLVATKGGDVRGGIKGVRPRGRRFKPSPRKPV